MLAIKYGHADNHFNNKFILFCHLIYFINSNEQKLMIEYIYCTFYTFKNRINNQFFLANKYVLRRCKFKI